jgi:hypothetical protein
MGSWTSDFLHGSVTLFLSDVFPYHIFGAAILQEILGCSAKDSRSYPLPAVCIQLYINHSPTGSRFQNPLTKSATVKA